MKKIVRIFLIVLPVLVLLTNIGISKADVISSYSLLNKNDTILKSSYNRSEYNQNIGGKLGETTIFTDPVGKNGCQVDHFKTSEGNIVYCYNSTKMPPDTFVNQFNIYEFYDGLTSITGNRQKVDEVASAIMNGYHKNLTTGKYDVAYQFQQVAEESFNKVKPVLVRKGIVSSQYSLNEYKQDVTQQVIWTIDGQPGMISPNDKFANILLDYAKNNPLTKDIAYPKNIQITADHKEINNNNPLVINNKTNLSQSFTVNAEVSISNLPKEYKIIDSNGNTTTSMKVGSTYRIEYIGNVLATSSHNNEINKKIIAKVNYQSLRDSKFYVAQSTDPMIDVNKYQNLVGLSTILNSFTIPIIHNQISSSSTNESSVMKSSSKKASASIKNSLVESSSKKASASVKSSSGESLSKKASASVKSSLANDHKKESSSVSTGKKEQSSNGHKAGVVVKNNNNGNGNNTGKGQESSNSKGNGSSFGSRLPQTGEIQLTILLIAGVIILTGVAGLAVLNKKKR